MKPILFYISPKSRKDQIVTPLKIKQTLIPEFLLNFSLKLLISFKMFINLLI